jgi:glutathione peroxidase
MSIYDFEVKDAEGKQVSMNAYEGKVLLIVNTATECGLTGQYEGLQSLYEKYHEQGFEILDFPCNQFANQAPGTEKQIKAFCQLRFGVTFKQFSKILVNGTDEESLFSFLKEKQSSVLGPKIKWNFTKFIVDRSGNVVKRCPPMDKPERIEKFIVGLL